MCRFEDQFPDVVLRLEYLHPDRVYEQVLAEQADLGLVSYPRNRADLVSIPWEDQPMVLVASTRHPLATLREVPAARLEGVAFLGFTRELPIRREIDLWLRQHQVEVELHHEFDNIETIKKAVECGSGVAILPLATVRNEVAAGELVALPLAGEPLFRPLGIIHKSNRQLSTAVQKFVQLLKLGLDLPEDAGQNLGPASAQPAAARPSPLIAGHTVGNAAETAGNDAGDRRPARRKRV